MSIYVLIFVVMLNNIQILVPPDNGPGTSKPFLTLAECMEKLKELVDVADSNHIRRAGACIKVKVPTQS